jgi:hypothetical protein
VISSAFWKKNDFWKKHDLPPLAGVFAPVAVKTGFADYLLAAI